MNFENPEDNRVEFSKERLNRIVGIVFAVLITIGIILSICYKLNLIPEDLTYRKEAQEYVLDKKDLLWSGIFFTAGLAENLSPDEPLRKEIKKADELFDKEKYKESYKLYENIYEKALSINNNKLCGLSLIGMGISAACQIKYHKTVEAFEEAQKYEDYMDTSAKVKLAFNLGYFNYRMGMIPLSIEYFDKTIELDSLYADPYLAKGRIYALKGKTDLAFWNFDRALKLRPEFAEAYNGRAKVYRTKGKYDSAILDHSKAVELNPEYTEAYIDRADIYSLLGKYENAARDYDKALELNPEYFRAYFNKAYMHEKIGDFEGALELYKKYVGVSRYRDKESMHFVDNAKNEIERLQKKIDSPKEIEDLEKRIRETDKLPNVSARRYYDTYVELGDAYKSKKQYDNAYETYMKALRLDAWDYAVQVKLAEVEIELQKYLQAETRLKNVIEFSKDRRAIKRAREFLDTLNTIEYSKQRIELPDMYSKRIYILETDKVDYRFTKAIKNRIMKEFKINVVVLEDVVKLPTRNARTRNGIPYQYDADEILKEVREKYNYLIAEPGTYGVLLVTSYDIFAKDYYFLFGWSGGDVAVISYSGFIGDGAPFDKQVKRFVIQSFSSTGTLIGIPRCTNPTCARAFPHSLEEMDKKEDILCNECLENLIKIYEKE
jgi:tetratricopeptide (TPR) repeat protein